MIDFSRTRTVKAVSPCCQVEGTYTLEHTDSGWVHRGVPCPTGECLSSAHECAAWDAELIAGSTEQGAIVRISARAVAPLPAGDELPAGFPAADTLGWPFGYAAYLGASEDVP